MARNSKTIDSVYFIAIEQIGDLRQAVQGLEKQIETLELDKQSLTKNLDEFSRHER